MKSKFYPKKVLYPVGNPLSKGGVSKKQYEKNKGPKVRRRSVA